MKFLIIEFVKQNCQIICTNCYMIWIGLESKNIKINFSRSALMCDVRLGLIVFVHGLETNAKQK